MVKKKLFIWVLAVVVIVSLVVVGSAVKPVAWAQEGEEQSAPIGTIGEITTELRTMNENFSRLIQVMGEDEVFEWTGKATGGPIPEAQQRMFSSMLDASGGRLKLQTIPLGEGGQHDAIDELNQSVIHFVVMGLSHRADVFPAAGLFDSKAGGMSPMEKYLWFISGGGAELAQQMIDAAAYNAHLIPGGGGLYTPEIFLHSNVEITEPADLVGLKIRSIGDGGEILSLMGAETVFLPGSEIYKALERGPEEGGVDAAEFSSPCLDWDLRLNEVATYVYLSECRVSHQSFMFLVNKTRWEELPDDLKVLVEKISREAAIAVYAETCQADIEALKRFEAYEGCTVEKLPKEVRDDFLLKADEYYDEKALENEFYAVVLQSLRDFEEDFREYWERP